MPYPLPLTRTEAYLAYKAGVIQQSDLKPSLAVPRNGIDAWLAYWTGLAADYPKREDGTPHILQEEEAYIAYLCGVINEYPEKCLRRVGAYLRYIISARWGRPDHPLNREELYLSLIKTQFIPSGDPSSDIVIDGTAKAPFQDVKMYGDTFQQTYTGKNLLAYPYYNTTKTVDDITFTDNGDGSVTVNGTLTGNEAIFWITRDIWSYNTANIVVPAGTYTISPTGDSHVYLYVTAYGETQGLLGSWNAATTSKTFTISEKASLTIRISVKPHGATVNNLVVKLQLESGSTATTWEKFVGGVPSPNPEYPQQIQTVTGEQTVTVTGKNLLNITSPMREVTNAGLHITIADDGKITIDGTATGAIWPDFIWGIQSNTVNHNSCKYYFPKALEAVTYSIKIVNGTVTGSPSATVVFNDDGGKNATIGLGQSQVRTATDVNGINRVYLNTIQSGTIFNNFQFYLQIESGTTATEVVPYSSTDYPISLGSIELCKLGTYQDYIYKDGSDWKVHKETGNVILTGDEQWSGNSTAEDFLYIYTGSYDATIPFNTALGCSSVADFYDGVLILGTSVSKSAFSLRSNGATYPLHLRFKLPTQMISSRQEWVSYLKSHGTTVCYTLATATDTIITDTALIAQLDSLLNGGAEEGTTYIKVKATDPNLPGLLYVEAPKYE